MEAQTKGRMRSNKAMDRSRDLRGMVHALKRGEAVWFAPDRTTPARHVSSRRCSPSIRLPPPAAPFAQLARMANPALVPVVLDPPRTRPRLGDLLIQPAPEDYLPETNRRRRLT